MSIEIGAKVKIKEDTEPRYLVGKTATVVAEPADEWDWVIELDDDNGEGEMGYNADELEVIQ